MMFYVSSENENDCFVSTVKCSYQSIFSTPDFSQSGPAQDSFRIRRAYAAVNGAVFLCFSILLMGSQAQHAFRRAQALCSVFCDGSPSDSRRFFSGCCLPSPGRPYVVDIVDVSGNWRQSFSLGTYLVESHWFSDEKLDRWINRVAASAKVLRSIVGPERPHFWCHQQGSSAQ